MGPDPLCPRSNSRKSKPVTSVPPLAAVDDSRTRLAPSLIATSAPAPPLSTIRSWPGVALSNVTVLVPKFFTQFSMLGVGLPLASHVYSALGDCAKVWPHSDNEMSATQDAKCDRPGFISLLLP